MKIRTVYFKVPDMEQAVNFWRGFLDQQPPKYSPYWSEFKCSNVNLGLLWEEGFVVKMHKSNFVPVFEFQEDQLEKMKTLALNLGATILVDMKDHPDKKSYVLKDPLGNEFEVTRLHD